METDLIFRILLPLLIIAFAVHRGYYVKKHSQPEEATLNARQEGILSKIAASLGMIGFIAMIVYVIRPAWLAWAGLHLPIWIRWAGFGAALVGFVLLHWAQVTLGKNWSDTPRMMREQSLITSGPYRIIRHPIYTAFILILGSTLLISSNWLIGLCWLGMTFLEVVSRIRFEEPLMIEYFGDQYREYMTKTGQLLPRI